MPMTSPVDFISGPSMVSTPGNLLNGNTASLTEICFGHDFAREAEFVERLADHDARRHLGQRHAGRLADERHGARGARIDFEDDRPRVLCTANCMFIRPRP